MTKKVKSHKVNDISIEGSVIGKKKISVVKDMSNFEEEPLKEAVWRLKIEHDDFLARADSKIDTAVFIKYLHFCIKRNEVINLSIRGRVRCLDGNQLVLARINNRVQFLRAKEFKQFKGVAELLTYDFTRNEWQWHRYHSTVHYKNRKVLQIETESGRKIRCDINHKFPTITDGVGYPRDLFADELSYNDSLLISKEYANHTFRYKDSWQDFILDRIKKIRKIKNRDVFCVSIENGNFLLANGVLVLNSGKSLSAMAIAMKISEITGVPFLPERHIKFSWEDYMNELNDTKDIPMHSVYVIDEKEETMGMGSYAEQVAQLNVQRICAKMCIHTISLVGDYTILSINSVYNLATRERDFEKFETRLILHNVENQEEIPLCSIVIPIKKVLCDTIINREVNPVGKVISGCILCHKFNNPKLCPDSTFLKRYEKAKDANIERVMKGGSASARQKLREDMAYKLLEDKLYATAHSKEEMKVLANKLLPRLTNRQFTMDEVEDIVVMTRIVKRDRLEKKEQLINKSVSTLLDYTETEEKPDGRPRKADRKHNSE